MFSKAAGGGGHKRHGMIVADAPVAKMSVAKPKTRFAEPRRIRNQDGYGTKSKISRQYDMSCFVYNNKCINKLRNIT